MADDSAFDRVNNSMLAVFIFENDDESFKLIECLDPDSFLPVILTKNSKLADTFCERFRLEKLPALRYFGHAIYADENINEALNECDKNNIKETKEFMDEFILKKGITLFIKGRVDKPYCRYTKQLVTLLNENNIKPIRDYDILTDQKKRYYLKRVTGQETYPMIFVDGEMIGTLDKFRDWLAKQNKE